MDHLIVARYNKMNTRSLYTDSYEKLPSLYKNKRRSSKNIKVKEIGKGKLRN